MKKLFLSLSLLCLALGAWADNVISYTATSKLEETMDQNTGGLYISGFGSPMVSHTFSNGKGTITFQNEITNIKYRSFYKCTELTGITIPNSVTTMEKDVFEGCTNITSVTWNARNCNGGTATAQPPFSASRSKITSFTFGPEVEVIPSHLCEGMSSLTSITIPSAVTSIYHMAFYGCYNIKSVTWNARNCTYHNSTNISPFGDSCSKITSFTFGPEVKVISSHLCEGMSSLTSITIPNSVQTIAAKAFYRCSSLPSVVMGDNVSVIGDGAFSMCSALTSIVLSNGLGSLGSDAFSECTSLTQITIPYGVRNLNEGTFKNCSSLVSIDLGQIQWISSGVFNGCFGVQELHIHATIPPEVNTESALNLDLTIPVYVPVGTVNKYRNAYGWSNFLYILESVEPEPEPDLLGTTICYNGLQYNLDDAKRSAVVMDMGMDSYRYLREECFIPEKITIKGVTYNVTDIAPHAFSGSQYLKEVTIPSSVKHIGNSAFANCSALRTVFLEASADKYVSSNAFEGVNLSNVVLVVPDGHEDDYIVNVWYQFGKITEKSYFRRPEAAITYAPEAFGIDFSVYSNQNANDGNGTGHATYDKKTATLTLNNMQWVSYDGEKDVIRLYEGDTRIQLNGYNKITTNRNAIYADGCKLTIVGPGILDIYAENGIISDNDLVIKAGACVNIYYTNTGIDLHGAELTLKNSTLFSESRASDGSQQAMCNVSRLITDFYFPCIYRYSQVHQTVWNSDENRPADIRFMEMLLPLPDGILPLVKGSYRFVGQQRGFRVDDDYKCSVRFDNGKSFLMTLTSQDEWEVMHRGITEDNHIFTEYATRTPLFNERQEFISFKVIEDLQEVVGGSIISTQGVEYFVPDDGEGLWQTDVTNPTTKTIFNGQVVIQRGDKMYDMLGREVR